MSQAFTVSRFATRSVVTQNVKSATSLDSCRRNNKMEKRKRNREYARKFASKAGGSRRKLVVEQKRGMVAASENKFQEGVYGLTTDDDMPAYSGFDFI